MNIVITGGAGYIGSVTTSHLLAAGHDVTVYDKLVYGGESLLAFRHHPRFQLTAGDVRDRSALRTAFSGADVVIHLAAIVGEPACDLAPDDAESINYGGVQIALETAAEAGVGRFLLVSTCSNYGTSSPEVLVDEAAPLRPVGLYAETKVRAEQLALAGVPGLPISVLRFGTICGLSPRMRFDLLISEMGRSVALGESIDIYTPEAWRPFLHIADAARALEHFTEAPLEAIDGRVFNVVGENRQKLELVEIVRRHVPEASIRIVERAPDLRDYRVDGSRVQRELEFHTRSTVDDAFVETLEAVGDRLFRNPSWNGHSAIPEGREAWAVARKR